MKAEATPELGQRLDVRAERRGAFRQRRRIGDRAERQPMDRRAAIGRGFQLLAERRAQRLLEARLDGQRIEQRRPQRIGRRLQRRGDTRFLGAQLGEPGIDLLQQLAGGGMARLGGLPLGGAGPLHLDALGFGLGDGLARSVGLVALGLARRHRSTAGPDGAPPPGAARAASQRGLDLGQRRQARQLALDLALLAGDFLAPRLSRRRRSC